MPKKNCQELLIIEFKKSHGETYDYSKVNYINSSAKIIVICLSHGEFEIASGHHKNGVGCRKCYFKSRTITKSEFIKQASSFFGNMYDYSSFEEIPPNGEKILIKCKNHNTEFYQEPRNHIKGHTGCPLCKSNKLTGIKNIQVGFKSQSQLNETFIKKAYKVHGNKYDYSNFQYVKSSVAGKINCKTHGEFLQIPSNHLKGANCPLCSKENLRNATFKTLCLEKNINYHRALKRRKAGLSDEKIFAENYIRNERETTILKVWEIEYPNIKEAVRKLNSPASPKTIRRWISEGMPPEEAFEKIPNPGYANGIIYLITNTLNNKKYIGLTIQILERRWKYHVEQAFSNQIKNKESLHSEIREFGANIFKIEQIDSGTTKVDLETKERKWINEMNTLIPNGYNISAGGVSGGSNKKPISIDGIRFESVKKAVKYISEIKQISLDAAAKRLAVGRVNVKSPSKNGESLIKTQTYRVWSRIIHGLINPNSKNYNPTITILDTWRDFQIFYQDVGIPIEKGMAFTRLDQSKGFYPENCLWMSKSESSKINAAYMKKNGTLIGRQKKNSNS